MWYNVIGDIMNIKESILNDMPVNLNKLEQARYIYLKLGTIFSFSTKFNNTTEKEYLSMYTKKYNIEDIDSNQLICKLWSLLYSELLTYIGIENKIVKSGHEYVTFRYNNEIWVADATIGNYTDLSKIKYGDTTSNFGKSIKQNGLDTVGYVSNTPDNMELLDSIDKKFDFYYQKKLEHNKLRENLHRLKEMDLSLKAKMDYMFTKIGTLQSGYYETKEYIKDLEYEFLDSNDLKKINGVELKRTNKKKEVDIIQCITINENEELFYYIVAPNQPVSQFSSTDIIKLAILGYSIDNKAIPGINFPKKFTPGKISNKLIKYRLFKDKIPKKLLIYDEVQNSKLSL